MLLIRSKIQQSQVHGLGLFATERIPAGTVVWRFNFIVDSRVFLPDAESLPQVARETMLRYCYINPVSPRWLVMCGDDARFMNFGTGGILPNTRIGDMHAGEHELVATRDIEAGEEILVPLDSDFDADRKLASTRAPDCCNLGAND